MDTVDFFEEPYGRAVPGPVELDVIARQLEDWISQGEYSPGRPFLSPSEIAKYFEINEQDAELVLMSLVDSGALEPDLGNQLIVRRKTRPPRRAIRKKTDTEHLKKTAKQTKAPPAPPLYEQIYCALRDRILEQQYEHNDFPTMAQAASEFGVSLISVKAAYKQLQQDSLIEFSRGRRPTVSTPSVRQRLVSNLNNLVDELERLQLKTEVKVVAHNSCAAGNEVASALGCASDDQIVKTTRLTRVDGRSFSLVTISVPDDLKTLFGPEAFNQPMSQSLLKTLKIAPTRVTEEVTAVNAQNKIARYLQLERGAAVLKVTRVFHTQNQGAIICTIGFYRPDEFAYSAEHISDLGETVDLMG